MIKKSFLSLSISAVLVLMMACTNTPKNKGELDAPTSDDERMAWWREAKFGLFIHWGVYAVPAGKYGDNTNQVQRFPQPSTKNMLASSIR